MSVLEAEASPSSFSGPSLISGQGLGGGDAMAEVEKIHQENKQRLQSMDSHAILREQQNLLEMLG